MKIISKKIYYLILVLLFYSCTSSNFIFKKFEEKENISANNWVTYKQPKNDENLLVSFNDIQIVKKSIINDLSIEYNLDNNEVIPKTKIRNEETITKADSSKKINSN